MYHYVTDPGHILFLRIYILSPITAQKVIYYPIPKISFSLATLGYKDRI
jgi:hypothetical protein